LAATDPGRAAALATAVALLAAAPAPVAPAGASPGWPTYGGSYANTRHSDLAQIRPDNVASLRLAWKYGTGVYGTFESSPVVEGDTLYLTTGRTDTVVALDAATGAPRWRYTPALADRLPLIMAVNRGVAIGGGQVYLATLDARLIALDARSGAVRWATAVGDPREGVSETMAPLAWNGLVFVGSSGGEYGIRGSFSAYSQRDGHLVWRWWSVSPGWEGRYAATVNGHDLHRDLARERSDAPRFRDAWRHGGGPVWMTPALSPPDATIYLSTGNPSPNYDGASRPGDNLYTDSLVALDARSGRMRWYYQLTPHDLWDYDAASPPLLFDALGASGRRVPAVGQAGKTGWFTIVDRRTGKLIRVCAPFVPQPRLFARPSRAGTVVQPGEGGGAIGPAAYDPALHSVFVAGTVVAESVRTQPAPPWPRGAAEWEAGDQTWIAGGTSLFSRLDVDSGRVVWRYRAPGPIVGGALSAGGLVFTGEEESGMFDAFDAASGALLWRVAPTEMRLADGSWRDRIAHAWSSATALVPKLVARVRGERPPASDRDIHAPPVAYQVRGREYVAIAADQYASTRDANGGDTLYVFALPPGTR
jgi:PQQ-dependent dehydrogenase (methanol/ethanol family)